MDVILPFDFDPQIHQYHRVLIVPTRAAPVSYLLEGALLQDIPCQHIFSSSLVEQRMKNNHIQIKFLNGLPLVNGVYRPNNLIDNGPTVNCNACAGMDLTEFQEFIKDVVV